MNNIAIQGRIKYFDIAKGMLICCLVYGHMLFYARIEGINDSVIPIMQKGIYLYNAFFMQTFFIITGWCSSFNKKFNLFLWGQCKSLIIPSAILILISSLLQIAIWGNSYKGPSANLLSWFSLGGPWFIISLFWSKLIYWFIIKLNYRKQFLVLGLLYMLGIALNILNIIPNYSYHRHVLLMLPYLFVGHYCKNHMDIVNRRLWLFAFIGVISIGAQFVFSQFVSFYTIPTHDANIWINKTFYIHIVNVITGSAFVLWLSKKINHNHILETLGKGTLLIYLWNGFINRIAINIIPHNLVSIVHECLFYILVYIFMLVLSYLLIRIIYGTKKLSWIVGKW